jgi:hypothetical protein
MERGTDHVYAARSTDAVSALLAAEEWGEDGVEQQSRNENRDRSMERD